MLKWLVSFCFFICFTSFSQFRKDSVLIGNIDIVVLKQNSEKAFLAYRKALNTTVSRVVSKVQKVKFNIKAYDLETNILRNEVVGEIKLTPSFTIKEVITYAYSNKERPVDEAKLTGTLQPQLHVLYSLWKIAFRKYFGNDFYCYDLGENTWKFAAIKKTKNRYKMGVESTFHEIVKLNDNGQIISISSTGNFNAPEKNKSSEEQTNTLFSLDKELKFNTSDFFIVDTIKKQKLQVQFNFQED
ncbi:hypothetical protein KRE40_14345 [Elizabethkingia meningoseptica]|uniref:hypothetical protein n=1 Tax=Elizabethkingia meningoseptica TaxID=238 RepID=UPI0023B12978|nr:hypothetical protein [Elizabethkingia meningoseptica]MDE5438416.1 hypothetical protein [Elizabethkingia meningoseptica]MDE5449329.1 hypothetical protein [Elizabethkingia meningoseptica]MDE5449934.1 hypothetical protein [Elizabethkingia meningoseptica]MDE5509822.1 hypothetical protein [Elizabethkingia meningoseptica]MDE5517189.1 hypothetical protein [Elizabethkingia meningoseptica]